MKRNKKKKIRRRLMRIRKIFLEIGQEVSVQHLLSWAIMMQGLTKEVTGGVSETSLEIILDFVLEGDPRTITDLLVFLTEKNIVHYVMYSDQDPLRN